MERENAMFLPSQAQMEFANYTNLIAFSSIHVCVCVCMYCHLTLSTYVQGAITRNKDTSTEEQRLRCFLVSLELPWEAVAHDILKRVSREVPPS